MTASNESEYPSGVPSKFSASGQVQPFPGNTILAHIPPASPLLPVLCQLYASISQQADINTKVVMLPPSSWHMTIIEGVTDAHREETQWPPGESTLPVQEHTTAVAAKLCKLNQSLVEEGLAAPYRMRAVSFQPLTTGIALRLEAASSEEDGRIRRLRDRLADEGLGFRMPGHNTYQFHVSVAYLVWHLDDSEKEALEARLEEQLAGFQQSLEFELGSAEFCVFDDMFAFRPYTFIADREALVQPLGRVPALSRDVQQK